MQAEVNLSGRHIIILKSGIDSVWGHYLFGVRNDGGEPESFETKVMLPTEVVDFQPQEGISPEEIKLAEGGGLLISKEFPPGLTLVAIAFKVDGSFGKASMTFLAASDIDEFTVMTQDKNLEMSSIFLSPGETPMSEGHGSSYRVLTNSETVKEGQRIVVDLGNLPQGRAQLWIIGGVFAILLLLIAIWLTARTKPSRGAIDKNTSFQT
jgi:hypothetical protein